MSILYVRSDLCSLFDSLYDTTSWKQVSRNAKFFYDYSHSMQLFWNELNTRLPIQDNYWTISPAGLIK